MTDAAATFAELERRLIGRQVTSTRMFLFTLQLSMSTTADDVELGIWLEPSWHIRGPSGVVTGSGAIDTPSTYEDDDEVRRASDTIIRVGEASKILVGRTLISVQLDPLTHALAVTFTGDVVAATFRDDPDATLWVLRDHAHDVAVRGAAEGIRVGTRDSVD